jgi:hypothetical protein
MKGIVPALNKMQGACMSVSPTSLRDLGQARKELFLAIREAMVAFAGELDPTKRTEYLSKFDKLSE